MRYSDDATGRDNSERKYKRKIRGKREISIAQKTELWLFSREEIAQDLNCDMQTLKSSEYNN